MSLRDRNYAAKRDPTSEQVVADDAFNEVFRLYKADTDGDYYSNIREAVEDAVANILEHRDGAEFEAESIEWMVLTQLQLSPCCFGGEPQ